MESGGTIRFVMRGSVPPLALDEDDLVIAGDGFGFSLARADEADLPPLSRLSYIDAGSYDEATAQSRYSNTQRVAASSVPLVMSSGEAAAINDRLLADAWVMRESASFSLPPSLLALDPADEVLLTAGSRIRRLRLISIDDADACQIEAVATDPSLYAPCTGAARAVRVTQTLRQLGRPLTVFLDLPLLSETQNTASPFVAAFADPWPGAVVVFKDGLRAATLTAPATLGETLSDFWPGPCSRFDPVNTLTLKLYRGSLLSVSDAALFAGANKLALQNPSGAWEIVQFGKAELIAANTWRLSHLLRGRQGSEPAMASPLPSGARVVLIDDALQQIILSPAEARSPHTYTYGPQGKPLADAAFQSVSQSFAARGLIPPAPCHLGFRWQANGDLTLSWKRRDRAPSANSIILAETPQSDPIRFDLEILSGGSVVRRFSAISQTSQLYTAAEQTADFPSGLPNLLILRVCQRSSVIGQGSFRTETLYVR